NLQTLSPGCHVRDGNKQMVPLFTEGRDYKVAPDLYLLRSGKAVAVLDPKYKPEPTRADRYEILAFCEALQVKRAIFVSPAVPGTPLTSFYGKTPSGIEMHEIRFDLSANNIFDEETAFLRRVAAVIPVENSGVSA